ncbi:MAG: efflux transporter outer membrane subunit [Alphaproteobacteria bacterium]
MNKRSLFPALAVTTLLYGCDLSPDFDIPAIQTPDAYKSDEEVAPEVWQDAMPYSQVDRGEWWKIFGDEILNNLQKQAADNSPSLEIAHARATQARAAAGTRLAEMMPSIDGTFSPRREKFSSGSPNLPPGLTTKPQTSYSASGILTWEIDLFGRLSGARKIAELNADAQEALYASALLSLQADVAQTYYTIRMLDAQRALLNRTLTLRDDSLRIARRLHELGETSVIDQSQAEAEYAITKAELLSINRQRDEMENTLAVLIGEVPSSFELPDIPMSDREPPVIPAGIPSGLLMRRPDVSAAIKQVEATNRQIGVARSAFFPRIALTAVGGFESPNFEDLFRWSNRAWLIGPGAASVVTQPIFEGGRIFHEIERFESLRTEAVAGYRQQVLVAFKEVEDSLNAIRLLAEESNQQAQASKAARKSERLARTLYQAGDIRYADSLDAERTSLATQRGFVQAHGQRWLATITLIRALGGSWEQTLPSMGAPTDAPTNEPTDIGDSDAETTEHPQDDQPADDSTDMLEPLLSPGA